jgi:nitrogen fixation protein NifZ
MSQVPSQTEPAVADGETEESPRYLGQYARPFALPREPIYEASHLIVAVVDLVNDGSHPQTLEGVVLVPKGTPGTVVRVGRAEESDTPVYLIEFPGGLLVGCLEEEIELASGVKRGVPGVME